MNDSRVIPPLLTRSQVRARCGLSEDQLGSLERCGALHPSHPGRRGAPALYTPQDVATAVAVTAAVELGLRGKALAAAGRRTWELLETTPVGQDYWALLPSRGQAHLIGSPAVGSATFEQWAAAHRPNEGFILLPARVEVIAP